MITCKSSRRIEIGAGEWAEIRPLTAAEYVTWQRLGMTAGDGGLRYVLHTAMSRLCYKDADGNEVILEGTAGGDYLADKVAPAFADKLSAIILDDSRATEEEKKPFDSFFNLPLKNAKNALGTV